jgi:hypothetical protein
VGQRPRGIEFTRTAFTRGGRRRRQHSVIDVAKQEVVDTPALGPDPELAARC